MTDRRWRVGDEFEVDGLRFRIRQGRKFRDDQVLEMFGPTGWAPLTFALGFVVMDVLGQNEDARYKFGRGGGYLLTELKTAYRDGWRQAWSRLQIERARHDDGENALTRAEA